MADIGADRKKAAEEEYFRKKERELVERLRGRAAEVAERAGLAESVGVADQRILDLLTDMGFDRETVRLLFVLPLLQVAWSDGEVSARERAELLAMARARGVAEGSPAHARLLGWLETAPDAVLLERGLVVIHDLLAAQPEEQRQAAGQTLVSTCQRIAAASGGLLGFGSKVSGDEQAAIERVAGTIEQAHLTAARRLATRL